MNLIFAIIGGGLTGTSMFCQFVQKVRQQSARNLLTPAEIEIQIYEKQAVFGPGFPHCDQYVMPYHITNMCGRDMSILADNPTDFQQWVDANRNILPQHVPTVDDLTGNAGTPESACRHYPRAVMGEYLKARFQEAHQVARDIGLKVALYPGVEVIDCQDDGNKIFIHARHLQSGEAFFRNADRVLLATGHWFEESDHLQYFTSPWPARKLLREIPPGEHVAVIGTSLSAIETVLTLTSDGRFKRLDNGELVYRPAEHSRKIALYSRGGMLPKVRGRRGIYRNKYLSRANLERCRRENNGCLTLSMVFELLNADLQAAYGRAFDWEAILNQVGSPADLLQQSLHEAQTGDGEHGELIWQTVLHQTFPMAREIYLSLTLADRKRFDRQYTTLFFIHAATQPAINAEKILALLKSGQVSVHKLGDEYDFFKDDPSGCYVFSFRDKQGRQQRDLYRYVVNARGQEKSLKTNPSALAKNLLNSRTVQIEEFETIEPPTDSGQHLVNDQNADQRSYKTGSIWIDPATHLIMTTGAGGSTARSPGIYAVGAMTRGQIIDASMAYGIARSTAKIAQDLVDALKPNARQNTADK